MNKRSLRFILFLIFLILCLMFRPELTDAQDKKPLSQEAPSSTIDSNVSITRHTIKLKGQVIPYTAMAGPLTLKTEEGTPKANVFFVAYFRDDIKDSAERPLIFCFNGGPGSSTVWLHLGAFAPKKVFFDDEGFPVQPFRLVDNPYTLIDVADVVFIDAISTGFSRPAPGQDPKQFHGVQEDIAAVGDFIRLFVTRTNRWLSPKFILGESYGTTRAAGLAGYLQGRSIGMALNGIILVSPVLEFQTLEFSPGNDLPYVLFLPAYAATAWYHKKLPPDLLAKPLAEVLKEAEEFAVNEYSRFLMLGNRSSSEMRKACLEKLARLTGLSSSYLEQANLRVSAQRFFKALRRDEMLTVGRLDSRFTGRDADAAGERPESDPSSTAIMGPFSALANHYLRVDLKYKNDINYAIYGNVQPWRWIYSEQQRSPQINMAETLRQAMSENRFLKVFVVRGLYDLATPYFAIDHTMAHIGLNGEFKDRVKYGSYEAGHMMYIHRESHARLEKDLKDFIKWAGFPPLVSPVVK